MLKYRNLIILAPDDAPPVSAGFAARPHNEVFGWDEAVPNVDERNVPDIGQTRGEHMSETDRSEQTPNPVSSLPVVQGVAPVVYLESLNAFGIVGDVAQLTAQVLAPVHEAGEKVGTVRVITAHLRIPVAAIPHLIGDLENARLLAAQAASEERN